MRRVIEILFTFALIIGGMAGVSAAGYVLAKLGEDHWFHGAGRLANILILMLVFVMVIATLLTLAERKWSAFIQDRVGPNRATIFGRPLGGLGHILADVPKMLTKEDLIPTNVNKLMFNLGPILAFAPVFALFAVVPAGPTIKWGDTVVEAVVATPDFGILYLFAIASIAVYGTSLAGWASNNKFALLGGVRASSQMISYEVALGLSLVGLFVCFSSVQLPAIVAGQAAYLWKANLQLGTHVLDIGLPAWGFFLQPIGFLLFFAAAFAETKRAPFDVPEGESEIIGYFVEYSGMKFGMFMISEFVEVVVLAAVITVLFFGGYHLPGVGDEALLRWTTTHNAPLLYGVLLSTVFWLKVLVLIWVQLLIRWTFPRFRYDQIQTLGWKILLPLGLVNVFVTAALVLWDPSLRALAILGLLEIGIVLALTLKGKPEAEHHELAHGDHGHGGGHGHAPAHAPAAASAAHPH